MSLRNQLGDIGMGDMPTQLVASPDEIAVAGPAAGRAAEQPAGRVAAVLALRAGGAGAALARPDDFKQAFGLVGDLARLLAILPEPVALALRLAAGRLGDAVRLAEYQGGDPGLHSWPSRARCGA